MTPPPPRFPPILLLIPLILVLGTVFFFGLYEVSMTTVTLNIDGQAIRVRTHETTVGDFLKAAGVWLEGSDTIIPTRTDIIRDGLTINVNHSRPVIIDIARIPSRFLTHADSVSVILNEAGITPQANNVVQSLPFSTNTPTDIVIRTPISVQLIDGSESRTLYTTAPTVSSALLESGVTLFEADSVIPDLNTLLTANIGTITIRRSQPVTIKVDTRTLITRTHGATVSAVLNETGISLVGLDNTEPKPDQPFEPGMMITVDRVTESDEVELVTLPFRIIQQTDSSLSSGTKRIIQPGIDGLQEVHVRVRRENGIEVSRSAPLNWQIQPPQDQIVAVASDILALTKTP